ncbi:hypothetical protein ACFOEE_17855 [Pseudoalteromonas fenneropenaei]|uniref:DUF4145 domain-containing protein n=1 Tax=Pseudoalteromonas fenneropenaei TaxID=1737459 RepID=A0ABV7CP33_9GAMM
MVRDNTYIKIKPKEVPEPESLDEKEVYAFFGLASYTAQCLEKALVNLAFTYSLTDKNIVTQEDWDALFEDVNKKTFGRLLGMVKKDLSTSDEVLEELKQALDKRNWLAHDYFFDSIGQFHTESGRMTMIKELTEMIKLFNKWDQFIEGVYLQIWQQHGLTEEVILREIEKLKAENA